ncbi:hypothetical protein [Alteraurantiacibacter buctensis]|uniref:Uncharacterized protein n=1 Tax=Alteraurantiacibacter buctensis TaxID=1503981 RepID=A0A844Z2D6_9SPHN|nr:hypothetical protein [Alteraurantiacibacter buctensis]MXO72854.1 hypothetical protein [Alteraurantiacibacter buctensis]
MDDISRKFGARSPDDRAQIARLVRLGVPVRVINCLIKAGLTSPEAICGMTPVDLLRIPGIARTTISDLKVAFFNEGLVLEPSDDPVLRELALVEARTLSVLYAAQQDHRDALRELEARRAFLAKRAA